ncbi:MAG: hypothetical protein AseanaTS_18600 [Candidatus Pelagadaptatus aseana]
MGNFYVGGHGNLYPSSIRAIFVQDFFEGKHQVGGNRTEIQNPLINTGGGAIIQIDGAVAVTAPLVGKYITVIAGTAFDQFNVFQ